MKKRKKYRVQGERQENSDYIVLKSEDHARLCSCSTGSSDLYKFHVSQYATEDVHFDQEKEMKTKYWITLDLLP